MIDLISRQAAIQAIDDLPNCYNGYSDTYDKSYIIGVLEELPSVEPKKGKWKPFERTWTSGRSVWACDACGETVDVPTLNGKPIFDYCPWCGSFMGEERSEDAEKAD